VRVLDLVVWFDAAHDDDDDDVDDDVVVVYVNESLEGIARCV
jgi:hypothetical protein